MYVKPGGRREFSKPDIFIPENYSGNAFSEKEEAAEDAAPVALEVHEEKKTSLLGGISSEDLLLLGVILLLSQEDGGQELLPILLMLLFLR